jgi:DNA-binding Xre family transcriptional regulator
MIHFNLKKHLKEKDITISELSEKTGISRNSLGLLINGKSRGIQFDTLEKIARIIDIRIEDLFLMSFDTVDLIAFDKKLKDSDLATNYNHSYDPETKES